MATGEVPHDGVPLVTYVRPATLPDRRASTALRENLKNAGYETTGVALAVDEKTRVGLTHSANTCGTAIAPVLEPATLELRQALTRQRDVGKQPPSQRIIVASGSLIGVTAHALAGEPGLAGHFLARDPFGGGLPPEIPMNRHSPNEPPEPCVSYLQVALAALLHSGVSTHIVFPHSLGPTVDETGAKIQRYYTWLRPIWQMAQGSKAAPPLYNLMLTFIRQAAYMEGGWLARHVDLSLRRR